MDELTEIGRLVRALLTVAIWAIVTAFVAGVFIGGLERYC